MNWRLIIQRDGPLLADQRQDEMTIERLEDLVAIIGDPDTVLYVMLAPEGGLFSVNRGPPPVKPLPGRRRRPRQS
jgi:hypothetical protein